MYLTDGNKDTEFRKHIDSQGKRIDSRFCAFFPMMNAHPLILYWLSVQKHASMEV